MYGYVLINKKTHRVFVASNYRYKLIKAVLYNIPSRSLISDSKVVFDRQKFTIINACIISKVTIEDIPIEIDDIIELFPHLRVELKYVEEVLDSLYQNLLNTVGVTNKQKYMKVKYSKMKPVFLYLSTLLAGFTVPIKQNAIEVYKSTVKSVVYTKDLISSYYYKMLYDGDLSCSTPLTKEDQLETKKLINACIKAQKEVGTQQCDNIPIKLKLKSVVRPRLKIDSSFKHAMKVQTETSDETSEDQTTEDETKQIKETVEELEKTPVVSLTPPTVPSGKDLEKTKKRSWASEPNSPDDEHILT